MIVTNITKEVPFPHEEGESAVIRRLSHTQLRAAAKKRQSEGIGTMREVGGELVRALRDSNGDEIKKMEETAAGLLSNYDRDMLLSDGLVSWSYGYPVTETSALDEETAVFLATQIFEFARARRTEAERKNA